MNLELLILGGYGQFVWPAFAFTFLSFYILYAKTKKEFHEQEKKFLKEFKQIQTGKIEFAKEKKALAGSRIFKAH